MHQLDVVDALLGWPEPEDGEYTRIGGDPEGDLARILDAAGSAHRVNDAENGLEERIVPTVREAVGQTIDDASTATAPGSAADHLTLSWQAAYGLHPDPVRAYGEAIKAVESAAPAVVEPNNSKATLGTMIRVIRDWSWRGLTAYAIGFAAEIPFMVLADPGGWQYTGPGARQLAGIDIAWVVGLVVTSLTYLIVTRSLRPSSATGRAELTEEDQQEATGIVVQTKQEGVGGTSHPALGPHAELPGTRCRLVDQAAEPEVSGVVGRRGVPDRADGVLGHRQGRRGGRQAQGVGVHGGRVGGEGHQGGHGSEMERGSGEMRRGGDYPAVESACFQEVVDDAAPAVVGDQQVRVSQVVVQADRGPKRQQARVEQAGVAGGEQVPGAVVGAVCGGGGHAEVDLAAVEQVGDGVPVGLPYGEPDARQADRGGQQTGQERRLQVVGHSQGEGAPSGGRIELVPVGHGAVDQPERRADAAGQFDGARCGLNTTTGPGEQLVVKEPAQPAEGGAGRALAQVQGGGGPGDAALAHQGGEDHQEIQVRLPEFGFINVDHRND